VSSTVSEKPPIKECFVKNIRNCVKDTDFCYYGKLDDKDCSFKIDTGSDVSIVNKRMLDFGKKRIFSGNRGLRYPTGEKVPIEYEVVVEIRIGKYNVRASMLVAEICDDCILGADFLRTINLQDIFTPIFRDSSENSESEIGCCSRIERPILEIPLCLSQIFDDASQNLNESQKSIFAEFLCQNKAVFSETIVAGNCNVVNHVINVKDTSPIKQVPRRIPIHLREEVNKIIHEMKENGVIEESYSPWISPAVLVKKKDGSLRFCVDYRKLNAVTVKDSYPLPRIDDILSQLAGNIWFSTLDLKSGYWQIKIRPEDRQKTAFSIGSGLWQFTVMPFGLCNAPATFERLMEKVLGKLISKICLVYLDDVIVFGKKFSEMLINLGKVFECFRLANLKINPKKCVLFKKDVKFLGHVVSSQGVTTDPEKIAAVREWPIPHSKKQLRSFLGFCSYYRRFVRNFSSIAKPLYVLTEDKVKFFWGKEQQHVFETLKQALTSSPILSFPSGDEKFILDTDASNIGIGAVLSQIQGGEEKVIAYFSRVLNKAERNYCVTRRELLAMVDSMKSFRHYLLGRRFMIRTDHFSLKWLMSFKDLEGQLARWLEKLQEFDFEILHRKGITHRNADGLSRRECEESGCLFCIKVEGKSAVASGVRVARMVFEGEVLSSWQKDQQQDPCISVFLQAKKNGTGPPIVNMTSEEVSFRVYRSYWDALVLKDGILFKEWRAPNLETSVLQLVVPRNRVREVLEQAHDSPSGGHFGINKTLEKIRKRFYWATCKRDVEEWCKTCETCLSRRGPSGKGKSPMQIVDVGRKPFERVQMDILGPFPVSSSGMRYLLVVVDCFTKWVEAFPLKNFRANTVAEVFVREVVSRHGVPIQVHTDQGRNFESRLFQEVMSLLGIRKTRTTPLHPQSDGQVERQHQTILNYLAKFISENQRDWDRWVPMFLLAYRSSKHEATGVTPAELYFGRDLRLPIDLLRESPPNVR